MLFEIFLCLQSCKYLKSYESYIHIMSGKLIVIIFNISELCLSLNLAPWKWFFEKLVVLHLVKELCLCWNLNPLLSLCNLKIQNTVSIIFPSNSVLILILPSHQLQSTLAISSAFFQNSVCISHTPHACYFVIHSILLDFLTVILFHEEDSCEALNPAIFFEFPL
jgi:hypothetical protein